VTWLGVDGHVPRRHIRASDVSHEISMIGHLVRVSTRVFHGRERPAPSATLAGVIRARTALLMTLSEENKRAATKLAVPKFAWSAPEIADGPFPSPTFGLTYVPTSWSCNRLSSGLWSGRSWESLPKTRSNAARAWRVVRVVVTGRRASSVMPSLHRIRIEGLVGSTPPPIQSLGSPSGGTRRFCESLIALRSAHSTHP
jgi:hypothetical protein